MLNPDLNLRLNPMLRLRVKRSLQPRKSLSRIAAPKIRPKLRRKRRPTHKISQTHLLRSKQKRPQKMATSKMKTKPKKKKQSP